jgi:putative glutamine amidotransferase
MAARKEPTPPPARPLIAINADFSAPKNGTAFARLNAGYIDAILAAGGLPLLIPPLRKDSLAEIDTLLDLAVGVVLTGGADMDPRRNGQAMTAAVQPMPARREDADRHLLARIFERKTPVLGVGLGMQQLNVFAGGTLHLHLPADNPRAMPHYDQTGAPHRHMVLIEPNTRLDEVYGTPELRVNSMHHQAVNQLGKKMRIAAKAPDGVIEAIVQAAVRAADGVLSAA